MAEWLVAIISAIGGAVFALAGREFIEWLKRPILEIGFEKAQGKDPFVTEIQIEPTSNPSIDSAIKIVRLTVRNIGHQAAFNCIVKLEDITKEKVFFSKNEVKNTIPWALSNNDEYSKSIESLLETYKLNRSFTSTTINSCDEISVDCFFLYYLYFVDKNDELVLQSKKLIQKITMDKSMLLYDREYHFRATVYSTNTKPKSINFKVLWDGDTEGFNKAFTKN